ncbi:hypothetical protein DPMN_144800 [Dreissena polymorpha]|uniref:Uncharacterized protein n=1 Tax=Dreissena polymorpha TaxID=45954 RepID=A0A9D4J0P2_DREPO|nr:hypothetical protein DPMN_144800 [Dreissena polymorpha]
MILNGYTTQKDRIPSTRTTLDWEAPLHVWFRVPRQDPWSELAKSWWCTRRGTTKTIPQLVRFSLL